MKVKEAKKECGCRTPQAGLPSTPVTQERYLQEKEKGKGQQQKRPVFKDKKKAPPKQDSKVKKFFKKILNFPEEKSAVVKGLSNHQLVQIKRHGYFNFKGYRYELVKAEDTDEVKAELDVSLVLDFTDDVPEQVDKAFDLPSDEVVFVHLEENDFPFETAEDLVVSALGQVAKNDDVEELDEAALKQAADYVETEIRWNLNPAGTDDEAFEELDVPEDGVSVELDEIKFPLASLEELEEQLLEKQGMKEDTTDEE